MITNTEDVSISAELEALKKECRGVKVALTAPPTGGL